MCHTISWYYGRCQHPDPEATSIIVCRKAFLKGYECIEEHQEKIPFSLKGRCLKCKLDALMHRQSIIRNWKRQRYWAAMNGAFRYHEDNWSVDESEDEESDLETPVAQSPNLPRRSPTEPSRNGVSFHKDPACKPTLVQPAMPYSFCSALVEYADEEEDSDIEPLVQDSLGKKSRTWRSWIPLPSRLLGGRQSPSFSELVSDDDMSDAEPLLGTSGSRKCSSRQSRIPLPISMVPRA
jgi:hypothetical protein